jgi:uncharacterized protein YjbJ (UPF0337 family)
VRKRKRQTIQKDGAEMSKKSKAKNMAQISKGKLKEVVGESTDNNQLEAEGNVDQLTGHIKQAGEKVKDVFKT